MAAFGAEGFFLRLCVCMLSASWCTETILLSEKSAYTYGGRSTTAPFALVAIVMSLVQDPSMPSGLLHPLGQCFQQKRSLQPHLPDPSEEPHFAQVIRVVGLFDLVHPPLQVDAFVPVCHLDRWRERRGCSAWRRIWWVGRLGQRRASLGWKRHRFGFDWCSFGDGSFGVSSAPSKDTLAGVSS